MARPPHVDQDRIDDAYATALVALEQPVNTGRIIKATETIEEALAELKTPLIFRLHRTSR